MGDLRQLDQSDLDLELSDLDLDLGKIPFGDFVRVRLVNIIETLEMRAEQLALDGRYNEVEQIYSQISGSANGRVQGSLKRGTVMCKLVAVYEKMGSLAMAEATQENIIRWIGDNIHDTAQVNHEVANLMRLYVLFYHRIIRTFLEWGHEFPEAIAQQLVLYRTALLDIPAFNEVVTKHDLIGVPDFALHIAVGARAVNMTKILLRCTYCDINCQCYNYDETALHIAVRKGYPDVVKLLLIANADLEIPDSAGQTALLIAINCSAPIAQIVELLITAGADVNARDETDSTGLHYAVKYKSLDCLRTLLDRHPDIDVEDDCGNTPLRLAAFGFNGEKIARELLQAGADPNRRNRYGKILLMQAIRYESDEIVETLLKHGADVNIRTPYGETALHIALNPGWTIAMDRIMPIFIKAGLDINAKNHDGYTALDLADQRGSLSAVQFLYSHGAHFKYAKPPGP